MTCHLQCRLFEKPLVPVVSAEGGQWLLPEPLRPMMKAGGYGAILKPRYELNQLVWISDVASALQAV